MSRGNIQKRINVGAKQLSHIFWLSMMEMGCICQDITTLCFSHKRHHSLKCLSGSTVQMSANDFWQSLQSKGFLPLLKIVFDPAIYFAIAVLHLTFLRKRCLKFLILPVLGIDASFSRFFFFICWALVVINAMMSNFWKKILLMTP